MVLPIEMFRDPERVEVVRKSEYSRNRDKDQVDKNIAELIEADNGWKHYQRKYDSCAMITNKIKKEIGRKNKELKKNKIQIKRLSDEEREELYENLSEIDFDSIDDKLISESSTDELITLTRIVNEKKNDFKEHYLDYLQNRDEYLELFGNIIHDSVPVSCDETNN